MVASSIEQGITADTYRKRAKILLNLPTEKKLRPNPGTGIYAVNCATTVQWIVRHLFEVGEFNYNTRYPLFSAVLYFLSLFNFRPSQHYIMKYDALLAAVPLRGGCTQSSAIFHLYLQM